MFVSKKEYRKSQELNEQYNKEIVENKKALENLEQSKLNIITGINNFLLGTFKNDSFKLTNIYENNKKIFVIVYIKKEALHVDDEFELESYLIENTEYKLISKLHVCITGNEAEIDAIDTITDYQHKGHGTSLIKETIKCLKIKDFSGILWGKMDPTSKGRKNIPFKTDEELSYFYTQNKFRIEGKNFVMEI